ncbi:MAG TPA: hypothetical protein VEX41_03370 [Candidatus Eisenbacteria bacterium]|nr:hypothetical protein [Candidatus Eisenbacteria bacterium]
MTDRAAIEARLEAIAAGLPDVRAERSGGEVSWSAEGHAFAVLTDDAVELRLSAPVAAAAANTPDTEPSVRGVGWVRFMPAALDAHAIDRLEAWFAFARRHAAEGAQPAAPRGGKGAN